MKYYTSISKSGSSLYCEFAMNIFTVCEYGEDADMKISDFDQEDDDQEHHTLCCLLNSNSKKVAFK